MFEIGFAFYADDEKTVVTTRNGTLLVEMFNSSSIGGVREFVASKSFSTNYEDLKEQSLDPDFLHSWAYIHREWYDNFDYSKPYYNGKYTNKSNFAITARIIVFMI